MKESPTQTNTHNPGVYAHPHPDMLGSNPHPEMLPCQAHVDTDSQMYRHTGHRCRREASSSRSTEEERDAKLHADPTQPGPNGEHLSRPPEHLPGAAGRQSCRDPLHQRERYRYYLHTVPPHYPGVKAQMPSLHWRRLTYSPRNPKLLSPEPKQCRAIPQRSHPASPLSTLRPVSQGSGGSPQKPAAGQQTIVRGDYLSKLSRRPVRDSERGCVQP